MSTVAIVPRAHPPTVHRAASVSGWRFLRAYTTTFLVIASYLWLGFRARLFGRAWRDANIGDVHTRNSRRVYATILRLQGLFIKASLNSRPSCAASKADAPDRMTANSSPPMRAARSPARRN